MKDAQIHSYYLHELVKNLDKIGESRDGLESIILEEMLFDAKGLQTKCCDYIGIYRPTNIFWRGYVHLLELKGSPRKVKKATQQLYSTKHYVEKRLQLPVIRMSVIIYSAQGYTRIPVM